MSLPEGATFAERYRIECPLGEGAFGEVYRAVDTHQDGQLVALKILKPEKVPDWEWGEACLLTRLKSHYVLPIYNADVHEGFPYLATGLATKGSLEGGGSPPRFWVTEALTVVGCAARGLALVHDNGIVHRDVKADNIFWSDNGQAMVGDFGVAVALDKNGEAQAHGARAIRAPEVVAVGKTTPKSDVWSLGATAYYLLAGIYPHVDLVSDNTPSALLKARCAQPPTPIRDLAPHISRGVATTITKALQPDPAKRLASMTEFDNSLSRHSTPKLVWREREPHDGHLRCWESKPPKSLRVCVLPTNNAKKVDIHAWRAQSGQRIRKHCISGFYTRNLPGKLKAIFENLGN